MSSAAIPAAAEHAATADHTGDPSLESLPAEISIWEAATAGREIILDKEILPNASEALLAQQKKMAAEKVAAMAKKKTARTPYTPATMEVVSGVQPMHKGEFDEHSKVLKASLIAELKQRFTDTKHVGSSLPHLTPATSSRAEHVTSSRVVGQSADGEFTIHERFHQNQGPRTGSMPSHDRFFATDAKGLVHSAVPTFKDPKDHHALVQVYRETVDASRADGTRPLLNSKVQGLVDWAVDHRVDDKAPPLSPRSRTRVLPDLGYGVPAAKHAK